MRKIKQLWNDNQLKLNGVYIDCVTKENADYIKRLEDTLYTIAIGVPSGINEAGPEKLARTILEMDNMPGINNKG